MFGKSLVNEFRSGRPGGPTKFNSNWDTSMGDDTHQYPLNINGTMAPT